MIYHCSVCGNLFRKDIQLYGQRVNSQLDLCRKCQIDHIRGTYDGRPRLSSTKCNTRYLSSLQPSDISLTRGNEAVNNYAPDIQPRKIPGSSGSLTYPSQILNTRVPSALQKSGNSLNWLKGNVLKQLQSLRRGNEHINNHVPNMQLCKIVGSSPSMSYPLNRANTHVLSDLQPSGNSLSWLNGNLLKQLQTLRRGNEHINNHVPNMQLCKIVGSRASMSYPLNRANTHVLSDLQPSDNSLSWLNGNLLNQLQTMRRLHETVSNHIPSNSGARACPPLMILNTHFLSDLQACGNNLRRLLGEKVRQDPDKMRRCNEIVDYLVTFMQHNFGSVVSEVVKGGSLGKGTSIKEKVDIDLVVFVKRFASVGDLRQQHEEVINILKTHIVKDFTFAKQLRYHHSTHHSNQFALQIDDGEDLIPVDLLPACDIGGASTSVFLEMARLDEESRSFHSVSFAKDQVKFTRDKPESVKDVICLIKHWKTRENLKISSYTVEIITIKEWEKMGSPPQADLFELFKRTMTQMSNISSINITWSNPWSIFIQPVVMDPVNPFNNTASKLKHSEQVDIIRKAREVVSWL